MPPGSLDVVGQLCGRPAVSSFWQLLIFGRSVCDNTPVSAVPIISAFHVCKKLRRWSGVVLREGYLFTDLFIYLFIYLFIIAILHYKWKLPRNNIFLKKMPKTTSSSSSSSSSRDVGWFHFSSIFPSHLGGGTPRWEFLPAAGPLSLPANDHYSACLALAHCNVEQWHQAAGYQWSHSSEGGGGPHLSAGGNGSTLSAVSQHSTAWDWPHKHATSWHQT